jgi:hypothetical protein
VKDYFLSSIIHQLSCFVTDNRKQAIVFILFSIQHHILFKTFIAFSRSNIHKTKMTITTTMTNSTSGPGSSAVKNLSRTAKNDDSTSSSTSVTAIITNNKKTNTNTNTNNSKAKSASLPSVTVEYLKAWMMSAEHIAHPYPTEQEKVEIMNDTGIELKQLTNWFVNNRKRYWKPRVEARLQQQAQQAAQATTVQQVSVSVNTCAGAGSTTSTVGGQQQQATATTTTTTTAVVNAASTSANLVSPSGFNSINKSQLTTITGGSKLLTYDDIRKERDIADHTSTTTTTSTTSSSSSLQDEYFATSPLTFAAIMLEQQKYSVPSISVLAQVSENSNSISSVASVSASEGEMSCDFGTDDASSSSSLDDDSKFVNKKKSSTTPSSSTSYPQEETKTNYTRSVSFCSLEYFSGENFAAPAAAPQEIIKMNETLPSLSFTTTTNNSSSNSRKRTLLVNEEDFPVGLTTTTTTTGTSSSPRKRFRTVSMDLWIDACRNASHVYDDECLPSLEEASQLFGYTH